MKNEYPERNTPCAICGYGSDFCLETYTFSPRINLELSLLWNNLRNGFVETDFFKSEFKVEIDNSDSFFKLTNTIFKLSSLYF